MTITIRKTEPSDAPAIQKIYQGENVYSKLIMLPHQTVASWQKRLANIPEHVHSYVAIHHDDATDSVCDNAEDEGEIVGNLGLMLNTRERQRHVATFGMGVKEGFQGQGVGSQLLATAVDLADKWLNLRRVELTVFTDNEPAIALYKKFGFVIEGEAVDFAFRDGQYVNAYYMARIKAK